MSIYISHISTADSSGGSAVSANRIHRKLIENKIYSKIFTGIKSQKNTSVNYLTRYRLLRYVDNYYNILSNKFGFQYDFIPSNLFLNKELEKTNIFQFYNLHGGFFSLGTIKKLSKIAPIILRFSDYWPLTGHCAYPGDCNKWKKICKECPDLSTYPSIGLDQTQRLWKKKRRIFNNIDITLIVPTHKMYSEVKNSLFFKNKKIYKIPNGIDINSFFFEDKTFAKKSLNIPNIFTMLFIAHMAFNNYRKGTHLLERLLNKFKDEKNIQFLIVGNDSFKWRKLGYKNIHTFDFTENVRDKRLIFCASDCKILTSINENFPNVILESMACGTPVIAFESGGVKEIISNDNGILVEKENIEKMEDNIRHLKKNYSLFKKLSSNAMKTIKAKFSSEVEIKKYIQIYKKVLRRSK